MATLHELAADTANGFRDNVAVIYDDGQHRGLVSYSDCHRMSVQIANLLKSYGAENEIVGVCVELKKELPSILLGILQLPAAFYCFDPEALGFVRNTVKLLHVRFILADVSYLQILEELLLPLKGKIILGVVELIEADVVLIQLKAVSTEKQNSSMAYCITTSGTTGVLKVVQVPHKCIVPNIIHLRKLFQIIPEDLLFLASPLTFDPSIVEMFLSLASGSSLLIVPHSAKVVPKHLAHLLTSRHHVTVLQATPTLVTSLGQEVLQQTLLGSSSKLRILALGGEEFPPAHIFRSWQATGNKTVFYNLYGITEVSCWATVHRLCDSDLSGEITSVPIGNPMLETCIQVVNSKGETIHCGTGQLMIGGPERMCLIDEEKVGQPLRQTGDWVQILDDGRVLYLGRHDDQIKRHGMRLNTHQLQIVVQQLEFVDTCQAVISKNNHLFLFVVLRSSRCERKTAHLVIKDIQQHIETSLPRQYWPNQLVEVTSLPMTKHGKLDRVRLLELVSQVSSYNDNDKHKSCKEMLTCIWKDTLKMRGDDVVSPSDGFITAGGDSFTAVQLTDKLESTFKCNLPQLFCLVLHATFHEILQYITEHLEIPHGENWSDGNLKGKNHLQSGFIEPEKLDRGRLDLANNRNPDVIDKMFIDTPEIFYGSETILQNLKDEPQVKKLKNDLDNETSLLPLTSAKFIGSISRGNVLTGMRLETEGCKDSLTNKSSCCCYKLQLSILWAFDTGKCVDASPLLALSSYGEHVVFIGSHSHRLCAVAAKDGQLLWETVLGDRVESSACLSLCWKYVIVGCYDCCVYMLDAATGQIEWKFQTQGQVKSSPVVDTKTSLVWFGSHDHHIYSLDVKSKSCIFKRNLRGGSIFSSPCISSEPHTVYIGTLGGTLLAIHPLSGDARWCHDCRKPLFSSPCLTTRGVAIGCVDGAFYHFTHEGILICRVITGGPIFSSPSSLTVCWNKEMKTEIICGSHDSHVYCFSEDGQMLWRTKVKSRVYATAFPFQSDSILYPQYPCGKTMKQDTEKKLNQIVLTNIDDLETKRVSMKSCGDFPVAVTCSTCGTIYVLCIQCGDILASYSMPGEIFSSPVILKDHVFVGCRDNKVYNLIISGC